MGLADQFEQVKAMYSEANMLLGDIIKVGRASADGGGDYAVAVDVFPVLAFTILL